ncbi:MAG: glycosyltransferase family 4 protein [Deltaproteobacteria bacterium]
MTHSQIHIGIFSKGRSHLWDLFMALDKLGTHVAFYSDVPKSRLDQFGNTSQPISSAFFDILPYFLISKFKIKSIEEETNRLWMEHLDNTISKQIAPCDLLIGLSGLTLKTAQAAKSKYGAKVWIERGSVHVVEQKRILESILGSNLKITIPAWAIERELETYELADRIVVASAHVAESFYQQGFNPNKIFINPYGVNLQDFPVTSKPKNSKPTLIFVGGWTFRKGCHLLSQILAHDPEIQLIHVGSQGDCPFPITPNFTTAGHILQTQLFQRYAKADILLLPSFEEGMSLVMAQALASGVPIVVSPKSGGKDLLKILSPTQAIKVIPELTLENIKKAIQEQLEFASTQKGLRDLLGEKRELLSWNHSAQKYLQKIESEFQIKSSEDKRTRNF